MTAPRRRKLIVTRRRTPVGAPPGTLIADPEAIKPKTGFMAWSKKILAESADATLDDINEALTSNTYAWIDIAGVGDAGLVEAVGEQFGIDRLALEDVLNLHQRPKLEILGETLFIVLHMVNGTSAASREQVSIFLGKNFIVTFQERPGDCLDPVRERLRRTESRIRDKGADYLAYAIIDAIIDAYFPLVEDLGERLEMLEEEITENPTPENVRALHAIKRDLLSVKRSLWPAREVMNQLRADDIRHIGKDARRYLADSQDHILQLIDIVETYRELASGLLDLYLSSLSNKMNDVMRVLTVIATIFIPLSFMAGVWGMNFAAMPELHWSYGYPAALVSMVVVAIGFVSWFRWRGWL